MTRTERHCNPVALCSVHHETREGRSTMTPEDYIVLPRGDGYILVRLADGCLGWQLAWSETSVPDDGYEERVVGSDMFGQEVVQHVPVVDWHVCDTRTMLRQLSADEADRLLGYASHANEQLETLLHDQHAAFAAALAQRDVPAAGAVYAEMGDALRAFQLLREAASQLLQA